MKFDMTFFPNDFKQDIELAKQVESLGLDGIWTAEAAHNPFLPLTLAASETERITLGTQIAVAFPRSPMVTAQIAWDLAKQSSGRFILGLGTQVRAHIVRRFSTEWLPPIPRMREYIESLHAIWNTFQHDERLRYRGDYYTFRLMAPFFNPGPIKHPEIPVYIAGVNPKICQLAGELCQGLHAHGFHTERYLKEVVLANVETGLAAAGRERDDFTMVVPVFVATGRNDAEMEQALQATKNRIAFYASTPAYKSVMELHGWDDTRAKLSQMVREGKWDSLWQEVTDEMLHEIAVVGPPDELGAKFRQRYEGLADRICLGWDGETPASRQMWTQLTQSIQQSY